MSIELRLQLNLHYWLILDTPSMNTGHVRYMYTATLTRGSCSISSLIQSKFQPWLLDLQCSILTK